MKKFFTSLLTLLMGGCLGVPDNVRPVENFDLDRYLGTWYEIARLDHTFERGLSHVTAEYSLRPDGTVKVVNKGYSKKNDEWKSAQGKASFVGEKDSGHLKVSFFGPFYGSYVIFELDQDRYEYAFVCGANTSYLWFLARKPTVDSKQLERFKKRSRELGFQTENLIFVEQGK